ncbi:MAG: ABC transporter substrate-binding protein, partial [Actinobacteria bacterium]
MRSRSLFSLLTLVGLAALLLTACGGGGSKKKASSSSSGQAGGTLITVAKGAPSGSPDPQINYTLQEWQILIISHDGLLAFKRTSGTEGTKLVPDLATAIPKPQDGGKTYVFHIRKGIKFSDGKELKPSDVKYTFERLFKIGQSPNAGTWYNVIVGGDACVKTPSTCDLSKGVVADDAAGTVTFHL